MSTGVLISLLGRYDKFTLSLSSFCQHSLTPACWNFCWPPKIWDSSVCVHKYMSLRFVFYVWISFYVWEVHFSVIYIYEKSISSLVLNHRGWSLYAASYSSNSFSKTWTLCQYLLWKIESAWSTTWIIYTSIYTSNRRFLKELTTSTHCEKV